MKTDILRNYIKELQQGPAQRTAEWFNDRKYTIGGSEVAAVMGLNPYSKFKDVVAIKLGIRFFFGNIATDWGILFESTSKKLMERATIMEIQEVNGVEGFVNGHRYSPDGLSVVLENGIEQIVLFEFKSPFRKIPTGKIPAYYLPQVMAGLANIDICDYALFVNTCFRKSSLEDWPTNSYDLAFHADKPALTGPAAAAGIIFITVPKARQEEMKAANYGNGSNLVVDEDCMDFCLDIAIGSGQMIDFGKLGTKGIRFLLAELKNGKYGIFEEEVLIFQLFAENVKTDDPARMATFFEEQLAKCQEPVLGFLPWKAMAIDVIKVERNDAFIDDIESHLKCAVRVLQEINSCDEPEKKYEEIFAGPFNLFDYSSSENTSSSEGSSSSISVSSFDPASDSSSSDSSSSDSSFC